MSDDEEHSEAEESGDEGPSEAELALKKRRDVGRQVSASGLDEASKELLETNRQDRERMEEEIQELRKRTLKRKKEREVEEKRLAAERAAEEERRKAAEEEKKKKKEEEELERKRKRDSKKAEFENVGNKPNFVISKRSDGGGAAEEGQSKKSREQLEKEKRAILKQRIQELRTDGLDQAGLQEKAKELHKLIHRLEGEKYDLEKRYKTQQVEMMELAERARQANRVGREGIKRVVLGDGESDKIQERFAGAPAKIEMFSKYERQKDKRDYSERKTCYVGPSYIPPPDRIKPTRIVKWQENGMPQYEDIPGAEGAGEEHGGH